MGVRGLTPAGSPSSSVQVLRTPSPQAVNAALVTIGIPAYNSAGLLIETLKSLAAQTLDRIIIHVHDDGSTDDTAGVALSIADPRLMVTRADNKGISGAANVLTEFVSTPYFARADADDLHEPHRLSAQLAHLESRRLDVLSSQITDFDATAIPERVGEDMGPDTINIELLFYNPLPNPLAFGRSDVFRAVPYSSSVIYGEDYQFWCDVASSGWRVGLMAQPLARYRRHEAAASSRLGDIAVQEAQAIRRRYRQVVFPGDTSASFRDWLEWITELEGPMSPEQSAESLNWAYQDLKPIEMHNVSRAGVEDKLRWLVRQRFIDRASLTTLSRLPTVMHRLGVTAALLGVKRGWSARGFWA